MYEMILKISAYLILGDMADICPEMDMAVEVLLPVLQDNTLRIYYRYEEKFTDLLYEIFS